MKQASGKALRLCAAALGAMTMISAWAHSPGRMTGGGSFFCLDTAGAMQRITHGFQLHCKSYEDAAVPQPNNLQINFSGGDHFHLDTLGNAVCWNTGQLPHPPAAPFDTMDGGGTGTLNGQPASIWFRFTDHGEPGTRDTAMVHIWAAGNSVPVLSCWATPLTFGNHQAHRLTGGKAR
ncbi:MAG TPA: hypothetical protein VEA35_16605 [Ramlibacter sp.]|nr:hypothetical protein [Ramlibacter sp.]